jgi:hypothetical protein
MVTILVILLVTLFVRGVVGSSKEPILVPTRVTYPPTNAPTAILNIAEWKPLGNALQGESVDDRFGYGVSLSANRLTLAAGAPKSNRNGTNAGLVRVYRYNSVENRWSQI